MLEWGKAFWLEIAQASCAVCTGGREGPGSVAQRCRQMLPGTHAEVVAPQIDGGDREGAFESQVSKAAK